MTDSSKPRGSYLSGNGDNPLTGVANHTLLVLSGRLLMTLGVPAIIGGIGWILAELADLRRDVSVLRGEVWREVRGLDVATNVQGQRLDELERRVGRIEAR